MTTIVNNSFRDVVWHIVGLSELTLVKYCARSLSSAKTIPRENDYSMADPLLADLVNPEVMFDLLSGSGVSAASLQISAGVGYKSSSGIGR